MWAKWKTQLKEKQTIKQNNRKKLPENFLLILRKKNAFPAQLLGIVNFT